MRTPAIDEMDVRPEVTLAEVVAALVDYPLPRLPTDPFHLVLWENLGAFLTDAKRAALFDDLRRLTGLSPAGILAADDGILFDLAKRGGMRPEVRLERWRLSAQLVIDHAGGDLGAKLGVLSRPKARALLKKFPVIGDPGADKILLFSGIDPAPAIDTNGLRSLVRLGFFDQQSSYAASYKAGIALLAAAPAPDAAGMIDRYLRLRTHGKTRCLRNSPLCDGCPFDAACPRGHADQF